MQEARAGYLKKAAEALRARLEQIESGKVVSLRFDLTVPVDHTREYDLAIAMLERHSGNFIDLTGEQTRCLVLDEWDWRSRFLHTNAHYSDVARETLDREDPHPGLLEDL